MFFNDYRKHTTQPTSRLEFDDEILDSLAKETQFIQRKTPGFSASSFALALLKSVCDGRASLTQLCQSLGMNQKTSLTKQALAYRFSKKGLLVMQGCLDYISDTNYANSTKLESLAQGVGLSSVLIKRVLLQDATQLRLQPSNSKHFKGMRNQSGWTSCVKLDTVSNLNTGELLPTLLSEGKEQDRVNGHHLFEYLLAGDLVLRDMGYFDVSAFAQIEQLDAFWVSRLTATARVWVSGSTPLEVILSETQLDKLDFEVEVTGSRHKCRLIAIRVPDEVANQRRAKSKAHRKKMGSQASKQSLQREGWSIYLTNLEQEDFDGMEIAKLYEQRWGIEIRFRALKGSAHIREMLSRQANKTHMEILLTAVMIFAHLGGHALRYFETKSRKSKQLSIEKVFNWLATSLLSLRRENCTAPYKMSNLYHCTRKRLSLAERLNSLF